MTSSIVIASIARTPIAKFCGSYQSLKASELGSIAIKGALSRLGTEDVHIGEAFMGNVCSAGMGQAPARQAVLGAGLPESTVCRYVRLYSIGPLPISIFNSRFISQHDQQGLRFGDEIYHAWSAESAVCWNSKPRICRASGWHGIHVQYSTLSTKLQNWNNVRSWSGVGWCDSRWPLGCLQ